MSEYEQIKDYKPLMASEGGICIERHGVFEPDTEGHFQKANATASASTPSNIWAGKFEPAPEPQMVSDCCKAEIFSEMDRSIAWDTKEGYTNEVFCSKCGKACVPVDKEPVCEMDSPETIRRMIKNLQELADRKANREPAAPSIENPNRCPNSDCHYYNNSSNNCYNCGALDCAILTACKVPTVEEIETLKAEIERLKGILVNMPTPEEAGLFVGLVEYSAPTDDWNINALKTCAAFYKLKAQSEQPACPKPPVEGAK